MSRESFIIRYPDTDAGKKAWNKAYGLNAIYAGKHWSKRRDDARLWHTLTVSAINAAHIRKRPFERPVVLTFQWNDRLDCSNHAYMAKLIEDGMKGILLHDDSRRWVRGIEHYFHDKPYICLLYTSDAADERSRRWNHEKRDLESGDGEALLGLPDRHDPRVYYPAYPRTAA